MRSAARGPLNAVIVAWILVWCALGFWVAREVRELSTVTTSVRGVGGAVVDAGNAISGLDRVPLVGDVVAKPGADIATAGRNAQQAADDANGAGNRLAVLLGLAVALIPTMPVLAMVGLLRVCGCWPRGPEAARA